jgi:hypothetical protein
MVAFHFWSHVRSQWSEMSWTRLAIEGMEFNLSPVVAYALIHIGGGWVQTQALRLVPLLMKQARIKRGSKHYHIAGVAAGVWLQVSVGVTMLVLVVGRTAGAGQRQEAFAFMDKPKEALVNTIEALLQPVSLVQQQLPQQPSTRVTCMPASMCNSTSCTTHSTWHACQPTCASAGMHVSRQSTPLQSLTNAHLYATVCRSVLGTVWQQQASCGACVPCQPSMGWLHGLYVAAVATRHQGSPPGGAPATAPS